MECILTRGSLTPNGDSVRLRCTAQGAGGAYFQGTMGIGYLNMWEKVVWMFKPVQVLLELDSPRRDDGRAAARDSRLVAVIFGSERVVNLSFLENKVFEGKVGSPCNSSWGKGAGKKNGDREE